MATTLMLTITRAGLDALVDAQNSETESIRITELGLSDQEVAISPTLEALPGEFKRVAAVSGETVSETMIHMTVTDGSDEVYDVRSIGLFLEDGTLFAAYGGADLLFRKVNIASFLFSIDLAFSEAVAEDIEFGDTTFLYPPASHTKKGVAELATQDEVDDGEDDERIVTSLKLAQRLAPILLNLADEITARQQGDADEAQARANADSALGAAVEAIEQRTITGGGLVTGGGSLAISRVLTVAAASAAQVRAGTADNLAITPEALGPMLCNAAQIGYATIPGGDPANTIIIQWGRASCPPNSNTAVDYPMPMDAAYAVIASGTADLDGSAQENWPAVQTSTITTTGFSIRNANDNSTPDPVSWIAIGRIDLS